MSVVLHNLYGNTIDSNTTDKQVSIFRIKGKLFLPSYIEEYQIYQSHVLFRLYIYYRSLLFLSSAHVMKQEISKGRNYFCFKYDKTDDSYQP